MDEVLLTPGKPDCWDPGRVASPESVNIRCAGAPLKPQQRYVWAVRVWDKEGKATDWARSSVETGLMSGSGWKAQWIARNDTIADAQKVAPDTPAHLLCRLPLERKPEAASLYVLTAGRVTAPVNGQVTGHHETHYVTALVAPGPNTLAALLGGGWYSSPITFAEIYGGESYDARLVPRVWASPGADLSEWVRATTGAPPNADIAVIAQPDLPIRNTVALRPVELILADAAHPGFFERTFPDLVLTGSLDL